MKSDIVAHLGQTGVLLPALIGEGLRANDRVKVRLGVLQAAVHHAHDPLNARFDLREECRAAGLDVLTLEDLVRQSTAGGAEDEAHREIAAPGLAALGAGIWDDLEDMVKAAEAGQDGVASAARARLEVIRAESALGRSDALRETEIARHTGIGAADSPSLHQLVMELHKALNRLSATHAEEQIAGAHAFGLMPQDRAAVEAFMRGLNATAGLKFDHPGLSTTAARTPAGLTIQNDIGETDAHVVVIGVTDTTVTVTYTDVHRARARFFTGLFRDLPVRWSGLDQHTAKGLAEDGAFYLVTGTCEGDLATRLKVLEALGRHLVFLIDWNKARKVLRSWVSKADALMLLDFAARNAIGQRGFLELGGADLLAGAVQHAAGGRIGFGERLDTALGREGACDFLRAVLRISTEALKEGQSLRLARDRIEAELMRHLQRVDDDLLTVVVRQAGLAREVAAGIAGALSGTGDQAGSSDRLAANARRIEQKADRIALAARERGARAGTDGVLVALVNQMEEAIDELEQAAFVASLSASPLPDSLTAPLGSLCRAAVEGAEAAATGAAAAIDVPAGHKLDFEDALRACGRLAEIEHAADEAERAVTAAVLAGPVDLRAGIAALEFARALERATDRLAGFGHLLRGHVLADLST
ncbi:hypothetical protein J5J86_17460 [Aquabacter sp. L1I39]|uniref:hypothetical protein n=1 Tax=Aquabacter sp. L1I39 TaxID=2820278 RepID=UPI001ADD310D|nr:hypothetical protein [Aquabacter sp. L1I39]QTL02562.1 hypothetical protein J5J86_17460 [Aquabacter sp. L1I39]